MRYHDEHKHLFLMRFGISDTTQMVVAYLSMLGGTLLAVYSSLPIIRIVFTDLPHQGTDTTVTVWTILGIIIGLVVAVIGGIVLYSTLNMYTVDSSLSFREKRRIKRATKKAREERVAWKNIVIPLVPFWSSYRAVDDYNRLMSMLTWGRAKITSLDDPKAYEMLRDIVDIWLYFLKGNMLNTEKAGPSGVQELGEVLGVDAAIEAYFSGVDKNFIIDVEKPHCF